jgi:type IV pilus assembly protein PilA
MRPRISGFTLIELVIVIAIIAILAAMVVSAYQTHTVRAQVEEALEFAEPAKKSISVSFRATGVAPANRESAGLPAQPAEPQNQYVAEIAVNDGRLDIRFGKDAHQAIFGEHVSVTPYVRVDGEFAWRCGLAPAPTDADLMPGGAEHTPPSIEARYLPASCRP